MKIIKRINLMTQLVLCSLLSILLSLLTECLIGAGIYLIGRRFGIAVGGYGRPMQEPEWRYGHARGHTFLENYHRISRWDRGTLLCVVLVLLIGAFLFFVLYFLLLTRGIMRDISCIANGIEKIAAGNREKKIGIERNDELGDIARQVNTMSEQIERLMESEREALQSNKDMIACVAHDLRTPLTSVIGYLQLATNTEEYEVNQRQEYAKIAMQKADRLQRLIEELFSYTKLMTGEISMHRHSIDMVKLVEQMVEEFYPLFQDNGLECEFSGNVSDCIMEVDGELLARAIQNLFSNAVKYGKDGKKIFVVVEQVGREIHICVTNFGLMIPKESIDHLFDKFYRVESSRSARTGGTGLGLNIAQEIAQLHGGKIEVESSVQGTCFTIALPLQEEKDRNS